MDNVKFEWDENIDYSDIPELNEDFWANTVIEYPEKKRPVTSRLDADVLEWFKSTGKGYQTRINAILRSFYEGHKRNVS
ncbi:MAG TPA: 3-oxoacyl-ACP synthase [bacterium]|nr:3-oxoacyl-ACP synthase [bacterium]